IEGGAAEISRLLANAMPGRQMAVRLQAKKFSISGLTATGMFVDADFTGSALDVRKFTLQDLAGTTIDISGRLDDLSDAASGNVTANIKSSHLGGFADIIARLGLKHDDGSPWILANQAEALSPADVTVSLEAVPQQGMTVARASLSGVLAGTELTMETTYNGNLAAFFDGSVAGSFNLKNPDSLALLGQFGLDVKAQEYVSLYRDELDPASARIAFEGALNEALALTANVEILNANTAFSGNFWPGRDAAASGNLEIISDDAGAILTLFGSPPTGNGATPAQVQSRILADLARLELAELSGDIDGNRISGNLKLGYSDDPNRVGGRLELDTFALPWLSGQLTGQEFFAVGEGWTTEPFDLETDRDLSGILELAVKRVEVSQDIHLNDVSFSLELENARAEINDFKGQLASGALTGQANIEFHEGSAALQADFRLHESRLQDVLATSDGSPAAKG
ncbi:MAG: hypothetical protein K8F25_06520, partial [Fimbriimonadaceae bacterium]|nr:hypothetical protein [Alphaproteobacteria bacterium]